MVHDDININKLTIIAIIFLSLYLVIESDFVGLMECDCARPFVGNNDLGVFLGEKLGMYVDYGPATRDHTWGLVRFFFMKKTLYFMVINNVCMHNYI